MDYILPILYMILASIQFTRFLVDFLNAVPVATVAFNSCLALRLFS